MISTLYEHIMIENMKENNIHINDKNNLNNWKIMTYY